MNDGAAPASDGVTPRHRPGPRTKLALRVLVSAALFALLASKASGVDDAIPDQHGALTAALLVATVATALLGVVLSAWRWQRVLVLFDARARLTTLFSHYVVGLLVGNALPSTIGGDVVRVARASGTAGSSTSSFGSVVLERLTGFLALPLLVFAGFLVRPSLAGRTNAWIALVVAGASLALLGLILFVVGHPRLAGRFAERESWVRFIGAVHLGVERLRREPRHLGPVLGTAILFQLSQIAMFGLIFRALDLDVPLVAVLAFAPAVLMIQVLPVSLSGLAVRAGALLLFLHSFGLTASQALGADVLWFGATAAVSLLGAPAFAAGHRARPAHAPRERV